MSLRTVVRCDGGHAEAEVPEYLAATGPENALHHRWPPKGWVTIIVEDPNDYGTPRKLVLCPECSRDAGAAIYPPRQGTDDWGHDIEVPVGTLSRGYGR